jgi:transcriptional regulator with XRE-family HTH domain
MAKLRSLEVQLAAHLSKPGIHLKMAKPKKTASRRARPAAAPPKPPEPRPTRSASAIVETEELGRRIRKLRLERRMTLKQVERAAGLSATHLSEIERGRTSPTIGALVRIARALEKDTSYFIERDERSDVAHLQRDQAVRLQPAPGVEARSLTPGIPGSRLFAYRITLTPGSGRSGELLLPAEEVEGEALYFVRQGSVRSFFGEAEVVLEPGDGVQACTAMPHRLRPAQQEPAEILALFTRSLDGGV